MKIREILVTNDDGIQAKGMRALVDAVSGFGNVSIMAPAFSRSGSSHAITLDKPLKITKVPYDPLREAYACSGTPVDCIKMATGVVGFKPDLVVSGINHGSNSSVSVLYSGTLAAAMEAAIQGYQAIAFSLMDFSPDADFTHCIPIIHKIVNYVLDHPLPPLSLLNVNIPKLPLNEIKGIKVTRQSRGRFIEEFEKRVDPHGRSYYWLCGYLDLHENGESLDYDEYYLRQGYVSVMPVRLDMTDYELKKQLENIQW